MLSSLRRAAAIVSLLSALVMAAGNSQSDLAHKAVTVLQTLQFTVRDGLADLAVHKDGRTIYIAHYNLKKIAAKAATAPYLRLLFVALGVWIISPLLGRTLKRRSGPVDKKSRPAAVLLPPLQIKPGPYLHKTAPRQRVKRSRPPLWQELWNLLTIELSFKRHQARHAAGRTRFANLST